MTTNRVADQSPAWSTDGKWLAFLSQVDVKAIDYATQHLAIAPSNGGEAKVLTLAFDRSVHRPRFSADGRFIYFIAEDDGTENLCHIAVTGGDVTRPIRRPHTVDSYSLGQDGADPPGVGIPDPPHHIYLPTGNALTPLPTTTDRVTLHLP